MNSTFDHAMDSACRSFINATREEHFAKWFSQRSRLFLSMIFVTVGVIGNALSITVFCSPRLRRISSSFYFILLAISDSIFLISNFITNPGILRALRCIYFPSQQFDITNHSTPACKLLQFIMNVFGDYSSCLILVMTLERLSAVFWPLKFKDFWMIRRAHLFCLLLFLVIGIYVAPYNIIINGVRNHQCTVLEGYKEIKNILFEVEFFLFRVIPVLMIVIFNILIIYKIRKWNKENQEGINANMNSHSLQTQHNRRDEQNRQMTMMLVLVASTYAILYLPVVIFILLMRGVKAGFVSVSPYWTYVAFQWIVTVYTFGFAINFFLYMAGSKVVRQELKAMCKRLVNVCSRDDKSFNAVKDCKDISETIGLTSVPP